MLVDQGLRHGTVVKVYLTALSFMQIQAGLKDPFALVAWPRLDYVVREIKKVETEKGVVTSGPRHTVCLTERCCGQPVASFFFFFGLNS